MLKKYINKFYEYYLKKKFIYRSKKISSLIRKTLSKKNLIYILDVGAGGRYLSPTLNFDGVSKIFMVDPNDNLDVSYNNLLKIMNNKKNIIPIKEGIYKKNAIVNYYKANKSTGSSFINYDKKLIKEKKKVYSYKFLKKKYKISKVDILKVDVEGLELSIIKNILFFEKPLILEVETNFTNSLFGDTFSKTHNFLSKNYFLKTGYPTYKKINNKFNSHTQPFRQGSYASPIYRNPISQMDCYYILKKKNYNLFDLLTLLGYGFIDESLKIFNSIDKNLNNNQKEILTKIFSYYHVK